MTQNVKLADYDLERASFEEGLALGIPMRAYKDRIFRMIFKEKAEFLELYNAMNGTSYDNPDDLIVTTLENAIYMGMKNDVSFMLYDRLALYEHQSSINPNMPLRDLFYLACVYSCLVRDESLFSERQIKIPEPKFVVFYNGVREAAERDIQRLSDAYINPSADPDLELKVTVLNINEGYNPELMGKCRTLQEYMILVSRIRQYSKSLPLANAVEKAVNECIRENILADFLRKNKSEVIRVGIFEYDEEKHMQQIREEGQQEGREEGRAEGREEGRAEGLAQGRKEGREEGRLSKLADQINHLREKGLSVENIADILVESPEQIRQIMDTLAQPSA